MFAIKLEIEDIYIYIYIPISYRTLPNQKTFPGTGILKIANLYEK